MNVKPTIEPVYKIDKPSDNYIPNEVYDTAVGYVKRQLKTMKPNDICPEHGKKFKKCCRPHLLKYGTTDERMTKWIKMMMKIQSEFNMETSMNTLWRTYGHFNEDTQISMSSEWGYFGLTLERRKALMQDGFILDNETNSRSVIDKNEIVQLETIYVNKDYRGTGIGSKFINYFYDLCNENDFTITCVGGSIDFSANVYGHGKKNLKEIEDSRLNDLTPNMRKRAVIFGLNPKYYEYYSFSIKERLETYDSNISKSDEKIINEDLLDEYPEFKVEHPYNDLQVEDAIRIRNWYYKHGFVPSLGYLNDWLFMKRKNIVRPCINDNNDTFLIKWCDKHKSIIEACSLVEIHTGIFRDDITLESTNNYMKYLINHRTTDLPFRDINWDSVITK